MQWTMKTPCEGCPFRKQGGIRLDPGRARAIAEMMIQPSGGTFPCHETTHFDEEGEHAPREQEVHCAGALIFAEKHKNATQMMRIAERIRMYDARSLMTENPAVGEVFDSVGEMVEANKQPYVPLCKVALGTMRRKPVPKRKRAEGRAVR